MLTLQRDMTSVIDSEFWLGSAEEELVDAEDWPSGYWTGEHVVPGQTLRDLASLENAYYGEARG